MIMIPFYREILTNHLRLSGIMWYFNSPYWDYIYLTLSELSTLKIRVAYGKYRIDKNCVCTTQTYMCIGVV